jgi:hypothetical protein
MKKLEFYSRALEEVEFRREHLADARSRKKAGIGILWFLALAGMASALLACFGKIRWDTAAGWFPLALMAAFSYESVCTQIAVLEAMEREPDKPPEQATTSVRTIAGQAIRQP